VKVFEKIADRALGEIVRIHYDDDEELLEAKPKKQIEALAEDATASGIASMLATFKLRLLTGIADSLSIEVPEGKTKNGPVLRKLINEEIDDEDIESFLKQLKKGILVEICQAMYLNEVGSDSVLIKRIMDEIIHRGLKTFFSQFSERELALWCIDSGISVGENRGKKLLIEALISHKSIEHKKKTKDEPQISDTKPDLKKGVALDDVFHYYSKKELEDFLNEKGVSRKGKARELARRVVDVLEGKEVPKVGETKKRKRDDTEEVKKSPSKKAKTSPPASPKKRKVK